MILVAATAIGFEGLRFAVGDFQELRVELSESLSALTDSPDRWPSWAWAVASCYGLVATVLVPFCWSWTLAMVALCLRRPRARLRRLTCQPGAIACFSASSALIPPLFGFLFLALVWVPFPPIGYESVVWRKSLALLFIVLPALSGFAVLGAWLGLLLGGRWRPESTWVDRAGRVLGMYWIGSILLLAWAFS